MKQLFPTLIFTLLFLIACQPEKVSEHAGASIQQISDKSIKESIDLYGIDVSSFEVHRAEIQSNENLGEILSRYNVSGAQIHEVATLPSEVFDARKLQVNKPYTIIHQPDSERTAKAFVYHPNPIDYVTVHFGDSVSVEQGRNHVDTVMHTLSGTINSSLYMAIVESGGSPTLVMELADVYAWAIDFFGLQAGDCFKVLYSTYEVEGKDAGFGEIVSAIFTHAGEELYAFVYDQGEGKEYFDEKGNSLQKNFLKAPLRYSRISSRFSYSRLHPILKIRRPHLGVDYAAPKGTPVYAVGDGTIIQKNYSRGAGNMLKLKHNGNYTTAYLHLAGFAKGIAPGVKVKQGDLIGFVGSTGLSTGPHLDFRFYKNGVPVDPLKVKPKSAKPIKEEFQATYMEYVAKMTRKLERLKDGETWLAMKKN
ncbi:MAG: peptidoglycan DD-metalloendopeptidase family protein [Bacteroidia bacterium]|nr:peptidoglycan DD-metalloendopeptidase family protein [Bacteroidia bacterium]